MPGGVLQLKGLEAVDDEVVRARSIDTKKGGRLNAKAH